jgi:hypothetical protein
LLKQDNGGRGKQDAAADHQQTPAEAPAMVVR